MNLFFASWRLPKTKYATVLSELRQLTDIYPLLDPKTMWHYCSAGENVFVAAINNSTDTIYPRNYVKKNENQVVCYAGLPINPTGAFPAHKAEALALHWDDLEEKIEGQYVVIRAKSNPNSLEVLTDILGYEQVYYYKNEQYWLVSNSVYLIEKIIHPKSFDELGVSLFLSTGWVGADRTLRSGIKVIPHGEHWIWNHNNVNPKKKKYYPPSKLAQLPKRTLRDKDIHQLSDDLAQLLGVIHNNFENIKCTLTGGRDSRLLAAMLIHAKLPVKHYTFGDPSGADVKIAQEIAQAFGLIHEIDYITTKDVINEWDRACQQSIYQTDGMRSLYLIAGILRNLDPPQDTKMLYLWGAGGEIARCFYAKAADFLLNKSDLASIQNRLFMLRSTDFNGLVRGQSIELVKSYIHDFIYECAQAGFEPIDIPDIFGMYQGDGRRVGNNYRGLMSIRDVFSPFCTRAFVEATYSTPAVERYSESLHYRLMKILEPTLHKMPFDKDNWPIQQPYINVLTKIAQNKLDSLWHRFVKKKSSNKTTTPATFDHVNWYETKRRQIRKVCLDQADSQLWTFIDKAKFERITANELTRIEVIRLLPMIFRIATLFYYNKEIQPSGATR